MRNIWVASEHLIELRQVPNSFPQGAVGECRIDRARTEATRPHVSEAPVGDQLYGGSSRITHMGLFVTDVAEYPKSAFPTEAVYGPTSRPTLRLITCGGTFDFSTGHYIDNVVVFAVAAPPGSAGRPKIPGA